jgi:F-type H+-transporting ATPase subunit b
MVEKTHTAVHRNGEHAKAFPPLDPDTYASQLIWLAITFGLLYLLARRVFLPRVGAILNERNARTIGELALAEKLKSDTDAAIARYGQALTDARIKANDVAKGMRETLATETAKERARIEAQLAAMLAEAESRIAASKSKALASIDEVASGVASAVVFRLIDKEVTTDEVKKALMQRAAE